MNIVWFRRDLRIADNPALYSACEEGGSVTAIYIATPTTWASHAMGTPQIKWLHDNLRSLKEELNLLGIHLIYRRCETFDEGNALILSLSKELSAKALYFNKEYEWDERQRDKQLCDMLLSKGIQNHSFDEQTIIPPHVIKNKKGLPYCVFTPFKRACLTHIISNPILLDPLPRPKKQKSFAIMSIKSDSLIDVEGAPTTLVEPGYEACTARLKRFVEQQVINYVDARDIPSADGTSLLSPYLALGVISVRQCIDSLLDAFNDNLDDALCNQGASTWISELLWRDFYKMICFNFPEVSRGMPFKKQTLQIEWNNNEDHFMAWKEGRTGVPIIDSAMRQLNTTGWMHNRLRMIVAMYFTKNLWQDWRKGEAYFASKLIDLDFASNNGGWQWCASTGTDAVPYFRVFNPTTQSERFDKQGGFIRLFCPELASLDNKSIHDPPLNKNPSISYPKPIIDLKSSRKFAIEQFKKLGSR
jgi:deoxyribodipyrimidine photo-lyase